MAESKLDIKVNQRELSGLEKMMKRVFSRKTVSGFNSEISASNRMLQVHKRTLASIVRQMEGLDRGTAKWKALKDQLAGDVLQHHGIRCFFDIQGQVDHLKDALEADHRGGELDRCVS